jgi:hypothetical protein
MAGPALGTALVRLLRAERYGPSGANGRPMIKRLAFSAILGFSLAASSALHAQTGGKAPCGSFRKLSDGKWIVIKQLKIENGGASAILNSGMVISPGFRSAGADIYAALQKSCQSP